jgi:hypothetical protein
MASTESTELPRRQWRTPVLHSRGVEETMGANENFVGEDSEYYPGDQAS